MPPPSATDLARLGTSPLDSAIGGLTASISKLQAVSNTATASLDAMTSAISSHIAKFVNLYSPAHVIIFERAVADLNATIGRALLPVLTKFTVVVREIANAIAGLTPSGDRMIAVMASVAVGLVTATVATGVFFATMSSAIVGLTVLAGALGTATAIATAGVSLAFGAVAGLVTAMTTGAVAVGFVSSEIGGLQRTVRELLRMGREAFDAVSAGFDRISKMLRPLTDAIGGLATASLYQFTTAVVVFTDAVVLAVELAKPQMMLFVELINRMTYTLRTLVTAARMFLGIPQGGNPGESEGMAIRNVRFGSVEDAWRETVKNSFSLGAVKKDPAEESANHLLNIWRILSNFERLLNAGGVPVRFVERAALIAGTAVSPAGMLLLQSQRQLHD